MFALLRTDDYFPLFGVRRHSLEGLEDLEIEGFVNRL
jgi:hypothetical protein